MTEDEVSFTLRHIPLDVWLRLKHRAVDERKSMQTLLLEALLALDVQPPPKQP
jgi:hypothetical protein